MANKCFFDWKFHCDGKGVLGKAGPARIESIIKFSKDYNDDIHVTLAEQLKRNSLLTIQCHRDCVSTYTSKQHLDRHKKRQGGGTSTSEAASQPVQKRRRSDVPAFSFKEHCLFCGELCEIKRNKKHPDRWKKAALCRTADTNPGEKSFKHTILEACTRRNDDIAHDVRIRVEGALSDLPAADARYHVHCMTKFMSPKSISAASNASKKKERVDSAFDLVIDDIAILSSPGLSSVVVFKRNASTVLNLTSDTEDDEMDIFIKRLAKSVRNEVKNLDRDQHRYQIRITKEDMSMSVSQTIMDLLAALTDDLKNTLPALLIGNIVTCVLSNKPTNLQIALGNLIRDLKSLINQLYQFRITCSYDEILRFKNSAALAATRDIKISGIKHGGDGLIQAVADNFDADISSQNCKITTHAIAIFITQPMNASNENEDPKETIPRISKSEMTTPIDFDIPVKRYQGPKTVPMPEKCSEKSVLPLKVLCRAVISERRAKKLDLSFLNDVINSESCPEYNGYNCNMLMSFFGAVGILMQGSGLSVVLDSTFAGVTKMLSGKKFPQNVRAFRLVVEELLRSLMSDGEVTTPEKLLRRLDDVASLSKTSKLWVDCFIKPVFIMMLYVQAEREGDWPLHLVAVKKMLPYFFASAHVNYERWGLYYLRSMERLGDEEIDKFLKGEHTMHHVPGLWNGIWSDMFIETTFMRYGHGPGGIIGITLKPETLKTWALGLHICFRLDQDVASIVSNEQEACQATHEEETQGRIASDSADRESIRKKLELCIDPLKSSAHTSNNVNIVSGQVAENIVNAQDAVVVGQKTMKEFEKAWPEGFRNSIPKKVKTVSDSKKQLKAGTQKVYDTNVIYSRVIGIQASPRDIDLRKVLSHELAPVPTTVFHESDLKKRLARESSSRSASNAAAIVLDGSAVFFDRYRDYSTKSVTRNARECEASRVYQLSETTPLPSQKAVLTVSSNKKQLMSIICNNITKDDSFHTQYTSKNKLVITGDSVPTEIYNGLVISRNDLATTHEKADNIVAQQAIMCAREHIGTTVVVADDTDVFVLLAYHYLHEGLTNPMFMCSPIHNRASIDIKETVEAHRTILPALPAVHALSGCDTVPTYVGIGKGTALKTLMADSDSLTLLLVKQQSSSARAIAKGCKRRACQICDTESGRQSLATLQHQRQRSNHCHHPQKSSQKT
ncbi:predicted protein [Nematostella vectensis]|uniref:Uncharacterized protein n=1 Tax=Nematostella vectensis TaxID=45351 RepID=A7RF46_NEMVE|nr:predicted protein [Nematostella vectensis]|eukprot:XP_001642094.1 predicted protein [Nematostella vectensis]